MIIPAVLRYYVERIERVDHTEWIIRDRQQGTGEKIAVIYDPDVANKIVETLNLNA